MDFIFDALQYLADISNVVVDFVVSIPAFIMDLFTYAWFWMIRLYISIKLGVLEMAYNVASMLLAEYEVYTVLNAMFNQLSPDLRNSAYQLGVVDAIRIVIDALATAFVLRIMGW